MRFRLPTARAPRGQGSTHIRSLPFVVFGLGLAVAGPVSPSRARPDRPDPIRSAAPDAPSTPSTGDEELEATEPPPPGPRASEASAQHSPAEPTHARTAGGVGFDIRFGLPNGLLSAPASLGLDVTWNPVAPLVASAGFDSNAITWSVHAEAQLNLLSFLDPDASLSPFVRGGLSYARFTRVSDDLIDRLAPSLRDDMQDAGTDLRFAGVGMKLATLSAGLDYLSPRGFHFQLSVGRALLLGESTGRDDEESVVLTEYASWTFQLMFGAVFF